MKNIKKYLSYVAIISSVTLLMSCYGEPNEPTSGNSQMNFGEYLHDMAILKGEGTILIQSNEFESIQNLENNIDISQREGAPNSIKIYDSNNNLIDINACNSSIEYKRLFFGNEIDYEIGEEGLKSMYIPKLLKLNFNSNTITAGSVINWNADSENEKGVVIWFSYTPLEQTNYRLLANHRKIITHGFTTNDTGTYVIRSSDLEKFPKDAVLSLNIARTNYVVNSSEKPSLIAFTTVSKDVSYIE